MGLIGGIILMVLILKLFEFIVGISDDRDIEKVRRRRKRLLEQIGELEGKPIQEIKAVIGEPNNVEIVDGSRILTWAGLQLLCTDDKDMIVKEVLQNIYE